MWQRIREQFNRKTHSVTLITNDAGDDGDAVGGRPLFQWKGDKAVQATYKGRAVKRSLRFRHLRGIYNIRRTKDGSELPEYVGMSMMLPRRMQEWGAREGGRVPAGGVLFFAHECVKLVKIVQQYAEFDLFARVRALDLPALAHLAWPGGHDDAFEEIVALAATEAAVVAVFPNVSTQRVLEQIGDRAPPNLLAMLAPPLFSPAFQAAASKARDLVCMFSWATIKSHLYAHYRKSNVQWWELQGRNSYLTCLATALAWDVDSDDLQWKDLFPVPPAVDLVLQKPVY